MFFFRFKKIAIRIKCTCSVSTTVMMFLSTALVAYNQIVTNFVLLLCGFAFLSPRWCLFWMREIFGLILGKSLKLTHPIRLLTPLTWCQHHNHFGCAFWGVNARMCYTVYCVQCTFEVTWHLLVYELTPTMVSVTAVAVCGVGAKAQYIT